MSSLKIDKKEIELTSWLVVENQIKNFFPGFMKLNDANKSLVEKMISQNLVYGKKSFKKWVSKNILKSTTSNRRIDFWVNRGYSQEEAKEKITEIQKDLSSRRSKKILEMQLSGKEEWKKMFNVHLEYWIEKGHSAEEAKKILSQRQRTFSLEKCIQKHGQEAGKKVWQDRQAKWLKTLSEKTEDEKREIKMKRIVPLGKASRESLKIFDPIAKHLVSIGALEHNDIFYGFEDRREWFLSGEEFFLYDFCIPKLKLIIEYQGSAFHPPPHLEENELLEWKNIHGISGAFIRAQDEKKRNLAESKGFIVEYLWGSDGFDKNFQRAKDIIFDLLEKEPVERQISAVGKLLQHADVTIDTPTGYHPIVNYVEKPNKNLISILLEDGIKLVCSDDHLLFANDSWVNAKDLLDNKSFLVETRQGKKSIIHAYEIGNGDCVDITVECLNNHYYSGEIVSHNCGKTLLALAAGLEQLESIGSQPMYKKLIVSRPVQPVGRDIGFLPGTLEEKMEPWIAPIRDNLEFLLGSGSTAKRPQQSSSSRRKKTEDTPGGFSDPYLDLMQQKGLIEIEAISFIRGRSIPNAFIIIDEAQNLSLHELKTIVTRAGEGTKIILTGDLEQIDNSDLDTFTNGLTYAVEKFKEFSLSAHITLLKGERSELATLAAKIL